MNHFNVYHKKQSFLGTAVTEKEIFTENFEETFLRKDLANEN